MNIFPTTKHLTELFLVLFDHVRKKKRKKKLLKAAISH